MDKHFHFIGIGGIGMSGIARLFLGQGHIVSGSDLKDNSILNDLRLNGAKIFIGHAAENVTGADTVVYSSAINEDNPEMLRAKTSGIRLIKRAEALALLMEDKTVITVAGSHGKTTTTSLVSCLLMEAGLMPTVAIGGVLKNINSNAQIGNGKYFVAEADESDGSFLNYFPDYSIITNIDKEHLDYYRDFDNEVEAFRNFIKKTREKGCVIACGDDPVLSKLVAGCQRKVVTYGLSEKSELCARNITMDGFSSRFECFKGKTAVGNFSLNIGGRHNILNSLAVIALGFELGIETACINKALSGYLGAGRRLDIKFKDERFTIMDDYAHHPTEIAATLEAVRNLKPKRVIAVFQPHRYTRTKLLMDEFSGCFGLADALIVTDIYPAGEKPIEGISADTLALRIKNSGRTKEVSYLPKDDIVTRLSGLLSEGDLVIILGAGDIVRVSDELAQRIKGSKN